MKFLSDVLAKAGLTVDGVVTLNNTATGQTPNANDNSTKLATTAWVRTFVQPYSLPIASASVLGGIKVGNGLSIDAITGVLTASGGGISTFRDKEIFITTAGQTTFTLQNTYTPGLLDVFVNGVYLNDDSYTADNGSTVVLDDATALNDIVTFFIYSPYYVGETPNARNTCAFTATSGQTTFSCSYAVGSVDVFYNGSKLASSEFTAINGTSIVLATACVVGDYVEIVSWLAGGGVSSSRTITINGVTYDLTANRTWSALPVGGTTGQLLAKVDNTDYNAQWVNQAPAASYTSQLKHVVKAGVAINKGQAVYVTSADGTNMIVGKASNASEQTSSKTLGLLETTASANGFANVITEGLLAGLDTTGATAAGDPVWLGTDGNLIYGLINKPVAPAHLVFIGVVTRRNANNGEIFVKVQNGFELDELHDLSVKNASDGDMIKYVASTGLWTKIAATTTNITEGTNLYYTNTRVASYLTANSYNSGTGTSGQVAYFNGTTSITSTSSFAFNSSESNLTIDRSLSTVGNAITISKGSDVDQAWLAFRQGGGASGTWRLGYNGSPYDFRISVGSDASIGTQALRIFVGTQNVVIGTATSDNLARFQVGGTATFSGNVGMGNTGSSDLGGRLNVRNEDAANNPTLVLFKNISSASTEDMFRVQSWNGAFNTVASIRANGSANFSSSVTASQFLASSSSNAAIITSTGTTGYGLVAAGSAGGARDIFLAGQTGFSNGFTVQYTGTVMRYGFQNGNVGIGTSLPGTKLHIEGTTQLRLDATSSGSQIQFWKDSTPTFASSVGNVMPGGSVQNDLLFSTYNGTSWSERMRITSDGYLKLPRSRFLGDSDICYIDLYNPNTGNLSIINTSSSTLYGNIILYTSSNPRITITTGGNVLIGPATDIGTRLTIDGTTYSTNYISGTQGLNVSGYGFWTQTISGQMTVLGHNISASSSVANQVNVVNSGWYSSMIRMYYSEGITFHTSSTVYSAGAVYPMGDTERVRIQLDGQVRFQNSIILTNGQINSLTSGGSGQSMYLNFAGNGAVYAGSSYAVLYAGSDERIKTEINHSQPTLTKILNLTPRTFKYKERPEVTNYGFIAQEVEVVMPELVRTSEGVTMCLDEEIENQKSVESYGLAWASILVKAIQEQQLIIESLKSRIETLEQA